MTDETKKQVGEAYAFFNCRASKSEIEKEITDIRRIIKTPNKLELTLTEGIDPESFKPIELKTIALEAKNAGIRYYLQAKYPDANNEQAAEEVSRVLNQAYQSPLYRNKEPFVGGIVYENQGRYFFR